MGTYTEHQISILREAVSAGREALWRTGSEDPLVFARAFIQHDGVQLPGEPEVNRRAGEVARRMLAALRPGAGEEYDPHVLREVHRARSETAWVRACASENVVGFMLRFGPGCEHRPECTALLCEDNGLGAGVFPKNRILVLPPACDDYTFVPVTENEVEQ